MDQLCNQHFGDGFNLTLKLNLSKLPTDEGSTSSFSKIACVREVVLGAPLRVILKQPALRTFASDVDPLVALVHRQKEPFFLIPQEEPKSVECLQPASRCCKDGMPCFSLSLICCCCCCDGSSLT